MEGSKGSLPRGMGTYLQGGQGGTALESSQQPQLTGSLQEWCRTEHSHMILWGLTESPFSCFAHTIILPVEKEEGTEAPLPKCCHLLQLLRLASHLPTSWSPAELLHQAGWKPTLTAKGSRDLWGASYAPKQSPVGGQDGDYSCWNRRVSFCAGGLRGSCFSSSSTSTRRKSTFGQSLLSFSATVQAKGGSGRLLYTHCSKRAF